jgi:hypothetical protein
VKNLQELLWEQLRPNRIKPAIIESSKKETLVHLLTSIANTSVIDYSPKVTGREPKQTRRDGSLTHLSRSGLTIYCDNTNSRKMPSTSLIFTQEKSVANASRVARLCSSQRPQPKRVTMDSSIITCILAKRTQISQSFQDKQAPRR